MEDIERIINAKNRIFQAKISFGIDNPISLHTDSSHVYRATGSSQIEDIIKCGYVRPPLGKSKGGHKGEVFWTLGSDKLFFYDKRTVIETSTEVLKGEGQIGAIPLDKLTGVWMFDEQQNKYVNNVQFVRDAFNKLHPESEQISQLKEQILAYDERINALIATMQPDLQTSRIIAKNNEVNSSQKIDSLQDYKTVVEIKQSILAYLVQVNKSIKDDVSINDRLMHENELTSYQNENQMSDDGRHL